MRLFHFRWVLLWLCICLTACGKPSEDVVKVAERPRIALLMKSMANEFFVTMAEGAKIHQAANSATYELILNGIKNESDLAQQVALVDQMISMGVDAIVIAPADSKALVPALVRAQRTGIVIINIDNRLDLEVLKEYQLSIPYLGPSNRKSAAMVANFALKSFASPIKVAILEGIPSADNSIQRRLGFEDAIQAGGHTLASVQSAAWDQTKAVEVTSAILSQHPDVQLILAANDNMALGAAAALGMVKPKQAVSIVGFDNISGIQPLVKTGVVAATVDQHGDQFAVKGIEYALEILAGGASGADRETPVDLVTAQSLYRAGD